MSQTKRVAFQKFLNAMRKLSTEVNDTEICKRLEILMATSKDDLSLAVVNQLLLDPKNFDPKSIPEPYTQYVRHFIYMAKRNGRMPQGIASDDAESDKEASVLANGSKRKATKPPSRKKQSSGQPKTTKPRAKKKARR